MRIVSIDISGRVYKYDEALYSSIIKECHREDEVICMTPYKTESINVPYSCSLYNLVPLKKVNSTSKTKRLLKAIECIINYIYLAWIIKKTKIDILHLQWLPFLEICSIEYYFLKWFKFINKKLKIILTVHNIYPHNYNKTARESYKKRFIKIKPFINKFVVHTNSSATELINEFNLEFDNVCVIKHGIFEPSYIPARTRYDNGKIRFLMYGFQSKYKGTDILIDAANLLSDDLKDRIEIRIVGQTSEDLYDYLENKTPNVDWNNSYVSDEELCQEIVNSDFLVYPYRKISQSGALLLGLAFNKPLIISDLPSFLETLDGYSSDMFFLSGNVNSLNEVIIKILTDEKLSLDKLIKTLYKIKDENSWKKSAIDTINLYRNI